MFLLLNRSCCSAKNQTEQQLLMMRPSAGWLVWLRNLPNDRGYFAGVFSIFHFWVYQRESFPKLWIFNYCEGAHPEALGFIVHFRLVRQWPSARRFSVFQGTCRNLSHQHPSARDPSLHPKRTAPTQPYSSFLQDSYGTSDRGKA